MTWSVRRIGDLAHLVNGFPFDSADFSNTASVPLVRIRDIFHEPFETFVPAEVVPESAYIQDGDVVVGMDGDFNVARWSRGRAALNQRLCLLRDNGAADTRFLSYALPDHLAIINDLTYATTVKHLSSAQVRAIRLRCPPIDQQRAIADYLDHETAQIDELVTEQQRLVNLLFERRRAITAVVLGARVGTGDRLKRLITEIDARACGSADGLPLLSVSISWGVRRREEVSEDQTRAENLASYKICEMGDLVLNRMRAFQGALGLASEKGVVSPDYAVLRISPKVDANWLVAVMTSAAFVVEMAKRVKGIGSTDLGNARTPRINISDLGDIRIDLPDFAVQTSEWAEVESQAKRIDALVVEAQRLIELATERRSALITAAVTGQITVPSAV